MSDWLDEFTMMGTGLNEGEKSLMRFAMKKEQERIIAILEDELGDIVFEDLKALIRENGSVEAAKTVVQDGCGDCKGNCCERL